MGCALTRRAQDEHPAQHGGDIVRHEVVMAPRVEAAAPRSDDENANYGRSAADEVDDGATGKVEKRRVELGEPTSAPAPSDNDGEGTARYEHRQHHVGKQLGALRHCGQPRRTSQC